MTGTYPRTNGVWANGVSLSDDAELFSKSLADSGYDCGLVGKLHLTPAFGGITERRLDDGFRFFKWAHDPAHASPDNAYHLWLAATFPDLLKKAQVDRSIFHTMPSEAHYTTWVTEMAIDFVATDRDMGKPFFLCLNYFDPHHPFEAPSEFRDLYNPERLASPIGAAGELDSKPPIQLEASRASHAGNAPGFVDYSPQEIQDIRATYYAMVSQIDSEVGRLMKVLDEQGLRENTLVIFTSDHGEMLGDHSLLLKGPLFYEGAVRVPLILRWPSRFAQTDLSDVVQWMDVGATILDAAGLQQLPRSQAQSLLPRISGCSELRPWALCEYRDSCFPYDPPVNGTMLRWGNHKLVVYHGSVSNGWTRSGELYDLELDPGELQNLWDDPRHSETRIGLEAALLDVMVSTEDRSRPRESLF